MPLFRRARLLVMTTRPLLSCIFSSEQFLQMTQVVARLASEISWIAHSFLIGSVISMHPRSHLGLKVTASWRLHKKGTCHKQSVSDPTQWRGGSAACSAALHPGVPEQSGGTWGLGRSSPGFPGGDPSGNQALPDRHGITLEPPSRPLGTSQVGVKAVVRNLLCVHRLLIPRWA